MKPQPQPTLEAVFRIPTVEREIGGSPSIFGDEMPGDNRPHAVVIGAGLGGLSTAIHLLRDGWRVSLLEKNERCGGRMNVIEEAGFRIDMGPTLLMMPEVIESIFTACGRKMHDYLDIRRLYPAYRVRFTDGSAIDMRSSVEEMQREATRIAPNDANSIAPLFRAMQKQYENARFNFIEKPFNGYTSLLRPQTVAGMAKAMPLKSVYNFVSKYVKDERLRQAFTFQTLYLGISPYDCPSIYALLPYIEMQFGVWFPMGGMTEIANALETLFSEMGGELHLNTSVNRILTQGSRACGVQIDCFRGLRDHPIYADVVVANVDVPTAYTRLLPKSLIKKNTAEVLERKDYGCSGFLLYLGVKGLDSDFYHHEVLLSDNYEQTLSAITEQKVIPDDPAIYTCIPTRTDPTLAPEGHDVLYILVPCPHLGGEVDWEEEAPKLREKVLDKLERAGMKNLRSKIVFERQFNPNDFARHYGCFKGSAFGLAPLFFQSACFRPQMRSEDVEGLYFTGAGTHPGGGVPIVLTSGRLAAETIAGDRSRLLR